MLPARTVNGATGVLYGPREHPNIFHGTGQHLLIFQENKGINLILGDRKVAIWKTRPFLCIGHTHSLLSVGNRSVRCFINIQKDADERKQTQTGRTNIAIYAPNLRYVLDMQIPTILYAHGEWECLQSKFVNCYHKMS